MKEIKIYPAKSFSKWEDKPVSNEMFHTIAVIAKDDETKFYIDFTEDQISEITPLLNTRGYGGHIDLHDWLKNNKKNIFDKYIHDTDNEQIVINLLKELKQYFKIIE